MNRYTKRTYVAALAAATLWSWCLAGIRLLEGM